MGTGRTTIGNGKAMKTKRMIAAASATLACSTQAGQWSAGLWTGEPLPWLPPLAPSEVQMMSAPSTASTTGTVFLAGA
jgi:hypothetical protein